MIFFKRKKKAAPTPALPKPKPAKKIAPSAPLENIVETKVITAEGWRRLMAKKK